jgi:hypothetical protein
VDKPALSLTISCKLFLPHIYNPALDYPGLVDNPEEHDQPEDHQEEETEWRGRD